jgi:ADP-ribose pyrophosphatase YjhB (NUDIX family)
MGVICFRNQGGNLEYLCICRKDSLGYIDFIRGKYSLYNKEYIQNLINEMTEVEKSRLLTEDFGNLWKSLWGSFASLQYRSEERQASEKFKQLKRGIIINKLNDNSYNLESLIKDCPFSWSTPEWGFPKGKRNYQETDFKCAVREFYEETGFSNEDIDILINVVPYEEIFIGSNLKTYKHKYYIAKFRGDEKNGEYQKSEISDMKWFTFEECKKWFRPYNKEKLAMLEKLNTTLTNYKLI